MSNYLAIATVTETLRQRIARAVSIIPGAQAVSERPESNGSPPAVPTVRVFLYQVTPNAAWRNADLPTRRNNGEVVQKPQVALDLHYLLSFYGDETTHEPQRMLGRVASLLHSQPLLTRDIVQEAVSEAILPPLSLTFLEDSDLVDQVESVKFSPIALNLEELSKLWSVFFQTPYILSVAFQGTLVLIESDDMPRTALPVRERTVNVVQLRSPSIEEISPDRAQPGATLTIHGDNLEGDITRVRVDEQLIVPASTSKHQITFDLPVNLQAGVHGVQVVHQLDIGIPPTAHAGPESNAVAFILEPEITTPPPISVAAGNVLSLNVVPAVARRQRVAVLIGEQAIAIPSRPDSDPPTTNTLDFEIPADFDPGTYLLRVRVDGAISPLQVDNVTQLYDAPELTVT